MFRKAQATAIPIKMLIAGINGSGKTFTALNMAKPYGKVAVIDAEFGSSQRYANEFSFDVMNLEDKTPDGYISAIDLAIESGYDVVILDSISPEWQSIIEIGDTMGDGFSKWSKLTPMHNRFLRHLLNCPIPIIATVHLKTSYVVEMNEKGKNVPRRVGMEPVQRDGIYGIFDVVLEMDQYHVGHVIKTRFSGIDGQIIDRPTSELMEKLIEINSAGMPFHEYEAKRLDGLRGQIRELAKSIYPEEYEARILAFSEKAYKKPFPDLGENELNKFINTLKNKVK